MNAENTAQRLQETAAKCLSSLDSWNKNLKDLDARESLLEAVHELRKVTSRLEIDIAMNDRQVVNAKPLPVPEHKSKMEKKNRPPLSDSVPVAELRAAGEKRKIAIAEARAAQEQEDADDAGNEIDDDSDDNEVMADNVSHESNGGDNKSKPRRPRRKKRED